MTIAARSILFVPGDRAERFEKARASGADMVVIDLEDAVLPDRKCAARDAVHDALASLTEPRFVVRVNSLDTDWHADDVRALAALPGVAETIDLDQIKTHYYRSHKDINPTGIVPAGPAVPF